MVGSASPRTRSSTSETPFAEYVNDPVGFFRDVLGRPCWGKPQEDVARSVAAFDSTAVATGHGIGKTWLAANLAIWFNQTRPYSKVITSAPKWEQIETRIWPEIRQAFQLSKTPLLGRCLTTDLEVAPNWFIHGENSDDPIKFQGVHAMGGVFLVVDEASGFPEASYHAASGFMTTHGSKTLLIGNPNVRRGKFFRVFLPQSGWKTHKISSIEAPEHIVRRKWIEDMKRDCGPSPERNPIYQVRVLGEFPDADESGLFPLSLLERSQYSRPEPTGRHMGVDVARFGGDQCVAILLVNGRVAARHAWDKTDLMRTATIVYRCAEKWKVPLGTGNVHVEVTGLGAGVVDRLRQLNVEVDPVDPGGGPQGEWNHLVGDKIKFKNRRAELYWVARRMLDEGQLAISENYMQLWTDLQGIPYRYGSKDQLEIASKDEIRKLLGRSPDDADALVAALSRPNRIRVRLTTFRRKR